MYSLRLHQTRGPTRQSVVGNVLLGALIGIMMSSIKILKFNRQTGLVKYFLLWQEYMYGLVYCGKMPGQEMDGVIKHVLLH